MLPDISDRATRRREVREFTVDDLEVREEGDGLTFDGIASVVDTPYSVVDRFGEFTETIRKGAFNRTIKQADDVRLLKNHDANFVFARTKSGTLKLSAGPDLRATAPGLDLSNPNVQILRSELARRDVDQMSIGMVVKDDRWNKDYTEREIREVALADVSVVTFPASPTTTATMRALDEAIQTLTAGEDWDEPTLRRAIAHLESLLPALEPEEREEVEEIVEERADVLPALQDLWAAKARTADPELLTRSA